MRGIIGGLLSLFASIRAHRRAQEAAEARGLALLVRCLNAQQRQQLAMHGYFEVVGGSTGNRYRIRRGTRMNIENMDAAGRYVRQLCFAPTGDLPVSDVMLAQKLALESSETHVLRVANKLYPH